MSETLLQETLRLIRESGVPVRVISEQTGLKVRWLHRLLAGDYADPGVNKIEALNHFIRRQLVSHHVARRRGGKAA